jgi:hypothetical protein
VEILFAIIVIVEIKVMMMLSSNIAAILYEVLHVLSVIGLERRYTHCLFHMYGCSSAESCL